MTRPAMTSGSPQEAAWESPRVPAPSPRSGRVQPAGKHRSSANSRQRSHWDDPAKIGVMDRRSPPPDLRFARHRSNLFHPFSGHGSTENQRGCRSADLTARATSLALQLGEPPASQNPDDAVSILPSLAETASADHETPVKHFAGRADEGRHWGAVCDWMRYVAGPSASPL